MMKGGLLVFDFERIVATVDVFVRIFDFVPTVQFFHPEMEGLDSSSRSPRHVSICPHMKTFIFSLASLVVLKAGASRLVVHNSHSEKKIWRGIPGCERRANGGLSLSLTEWVAPGALSDAGRRGRPSSPSGHGFPGKKKVVWLGPASPSSSSSEQTDDQVSPTPESESHLFYLDAVPFVQFDRNRNFRFAKLDGSTQTVLLGDVVDSPPSSSVPQTSSSVPHGPASPRSFWRLVSASDGGPPPASSFIPDIGIQRNRHPTPLQLQRPAEGVERAEWARRLRVAKLRAHNLFGWRSGVGSWELQQRGGHIVYPPVEINVVGGVVPDREQGGTAARLLEGAWENGEGRMHYPLVPKPREG